MRLRLMIAGLVLLTAGPVCAAQVLVSIDENNQEMTVSVDGQQEYVWPVSTGVMRHETPTGSYRPFRMEEDHFSEEWDDAPMPHSIFFTRSGHAIHGTEHLDKLGRRASHGCVRLAPEDAATLYALVAESGMANTIVMVRAGGDEPVQPWVENPPQLVEDLPLQLAEDPPRQFADKPLQQMVEKTQVDNARHRRLRRADDPFLESFN